MDKFNSHKEALKEYDSKRYRFLEKVLNEEGRPKAAQRNSKFKITLYRFNKYSPTKSIYK